MLGDDPALPVSIETFPFHEILDHYRILGRNYAYSELVACLRDVRRRLPPPRSLEERLLIDWLPSTFDQNDGDYDSYLVMPMLERLAAAGWTAETDPVPDTDVVLDTELAALLADLLLTEGEALAANPDAHRQRVRTHATLQALARLGELAPKAYGIDTIAGWPQRSVDRNDAALATRARAFAQAILDGTPAIVRHAVEIAMLPTTPVHDEVMFIRSVQLFELIYRQIFRCLERTIAALRADDVATATAELGDAVRRVEGTPILYRVLTTMCRESFAIIRAHTDGRSAIQSRAYRQVERISAPRPPGPVNDKVAKVKVPSPSLQEVYASRVAASGGDSVPSVAAAMTRLDHGWRAMKRTHWGITLKIIGNVPGTGGTSGAAYLKTSTETPLFPLLHEQAEGQRCAN